MSNEAKAPDDALTDEPPPYERLPDEPPVQFERFHAYLMMGPNRSLIGSYKIFCDAARKGLKRPVDLPGSWKETARRWRWRERAAAWDAEQREKREQEVDAQKREIYGELLAMGRKLLKSAEQMNSFPLVETESETTDKDGKKTVVLKPVRWSKETSARTANVAASLFKTAFELEDNRAGAEFDAQNEDHIEGAIEALKALGFIVVAPGQEIPDADEDS